MGARRHKKKTYTTPKRQKHVRKKTKLPILKFYKVSDGGEEVERLLQECTQPSCGAGMFMADHKDRLYCGKCHHTIFKKTQDNAGKRTE